MGDVGGSCDHRKKQVLRKRLLRKRKRRLAAVGAQPDDQKPQAGAESSEAEPESEAEAEEQQRRLAHELWLERERQAQALWLARQAIAEAERVRREEAERLIKEEWERQQKLEREAAEKKRIEEAEKKQKQEALLKEVTAGTRSKTTDGGAWKNPDAPAGTVAVAAAQVCSFYAKTGCCRFGDRCSRVHDRPAVSPTLLIPGMYSHFCMERGHGDKFDSDIALEYDEGEFYRDFCNFYDDVLPAFKAVGRVVQFKVCCNREQHLRGNVYVQYSSETDAARAYASFNGRWYAGRQLSCSFAPVTKWKPAICGLFHRNRCPKGNSCNFLHVFRNPTGEFRLADMDLEPDKETRSLRDSDRTRDRYSSHSRRSSRSSSRRASNSSPSGYSHRSSSRHHSSRHSNSRSEHKSPSSSRHRHFDRDSPTSAHCKRSHTSQSPDNVHIGNSANTANGGLRRRRSRGGEADVRLASTVRSRRHVSADSDMAPDLAVAGVNDAHSRCLERLSWNSSSDEEKEHNNFGSPNRSGADRCLETYQRDKGQRDTGHHRTRIDTSRTRSHDRKRRHHSKSPRRDKRSSKLKASTTSGSTVAGASLAEDSPKQPSSHHRKKSRKEQVIDGPARECHGTHMHRGDLITGAKIMTENALISASGNESSNVAVDAVLCSTLMDTAQAELFDNADPRFCRTPSTVGGESP